MIISHKHRFIFIKTVKTAGTSVEVDLNKVLGPDDVATPIFPPVEGHVAQNSTWRKWGLLERQYSNHMPALEVEKAIGRKMFQEYFVFCIEREPVDKCISHFSMLLNSPMHNEKTKGMTINKYIERGRFPIDVGKYIDKKGNLIVDRILRYETLAEELREVGEMLGFEVPLKAREKSGLREDVTLSNAQVDTIYNAFETSNRFTGYHR